MITPNNQLSAANIDKMFYTTGNDFTLSGSNYIGYVNIVDGSAFEGKTDQSQILQPSGDVRSLIFTDKDSFFDRTIFDTLSLPYNKQDIQFQPNELINRNSFNFKIKRLYDNFKEIYRFSEMSIPNIPRNFTGFAAISGALDEEGDAVPPFDLEWVEGVINTSSFVPFTEYNPLFRDDNEYFNLFINNEQEDITIFFSVSNTIFVYEIDNPLPQSGTTHSTFNFILSTDSFGNYDELIFGEISNTTDDGDKVLYVADRLKNNVHKFDVSSLVNNDRTGFKQFRLIDTVGGTGNLPSNFTSIEKIEYGLDSLFIYDSGEYTLKKFTKELNYVSSYRNERFFKENKVVDVTTDRYQKLIYILTLNYKIHVISASDLSFVTTYNLNKEYFGSSFPIRLLVSTNNSNIYYLQTTKDVYKGYISRFKDGSDSVIGQFKITANVNFAKQWEEYTDTSFDYWSNPSDPTTGTDDYWDDESNSNSFNFLGIENLQLESNYEKIYTITDKSILEFTENDSTVSVLSDVRPIFFNLKEIEIKDDYFNAFNYNSSLYKLAFNLNLLSANICKYLKVRYINGRKEFYSLSNIDPDVIENIKLIDQNEIYVGVNEVIDTNVFNRTVEKLYSYQELLLQAYSVKVLNTKLPSLSTIAF